MTVKSTARAMRVGALILWGLVVAVPAAAMQTASATALGTVHLAQAVKANGQDLAAGTYTLRLSSESVTPVAGQPAGSEQWVEFVKNGKVVGKELATKIAPADVKQVAKMAPPAAGANKVQVLKGADYVRIWMNRSGTQYLVHLPAVAK